MRNFVLTTAATACAAGIALSSPASAQESDCSIDPGIQNETLRDGTQSCNTVFIDPALAMLSTGELIGEAVIRCGNLPNGPYRRVDLANSNDKFFGDFGDRRFDYLTLIVNASGNGDTVRLGPNNGNTTGGNPTIVDQLGFNPGVQMQVTWSSKSAGQGNSDFTVIDDFTAVNGESRSQIVDAPGMEFIYFIKEGGNNQFATLICDPNMFFDDGSGLQFGTKFRITHGVNKMIFGWAAGPSGLRTQSNVDASCGMAAGVGGDTGQNAQLGPDDPRPDDAGGDGAVAQEAFVSAIVGTYQQEFGNPVAPINITSCVPNPDGYAAYCDNFEPPTSANSCNPLGLVGNSPGAAVTSATFTGVPPQQAQAGLRTAASALQLNASGNCSSETYSSGGGSLSVGTVFSFCSLLGQ